MTSQYDIAVIGAGPAGISAAVEASTHGASVCLLDEQESAGGQIYRNISNVNEEQANILGRDYIYGRSLLADLVGSQVLHQAGVTVWKVGKDGEVAFSRYGEAKVIMAKHLIIANGAIERPTPLPGWTLPGVMTVGSAQILMKTAAIVPPQAVLVGSGPLLYLVANQLVAAGVPPKALVETQTHQNLFRAMRHFIPALKGYRQLSKGILLVASLKLAGVPRFTGAYDIQIDGNNEVETVRFRSGGRIHSISTSTVLLHQGVIPNTQITRSLGLDHVYDTMQRCFRPVTDDFGQSSEPNVTIVGDGAGIGGARAAELSGRIGGLNAAHLVGQIDDRTKARLSAPLMKKRSQELGIRSFLDAAYPPQQSILIPEDQVIICRCEEVRAGDIRRYAALGCRGPNQTKSFGRSGMGPCQGRYCGPTVTEILAAETGQAPDEVGSYRIRAPLKPVTLGELASLSHPTREN